MSSATLKYIDELIARYSLAPHDADFLRQLAFQIEDLEKKKRTLEESLSYADEKIRRDSK